MINSFLDKLFRKLRHRQVLKHIPNGVAVCDVGCGASPQLLLDLTNKIKEGIGLDKETPTLKWNERVRTETCDLDENSKIPLSDGEIELVLMLAVLEHLERPIEILKEVKRILKNNGIVILTTPTPSSKPILEFLAFRLGLISKRAILEHRYYFSKRELINIFNELGFRDIKHHFFDLGFNQMIIGQK